MTIIRNDIGEVRLVWRLILIILLYVAAAVLLRLLPVSLLTAILINGAIALGEALEKASSIILENPFWNTAIGVLSGLIGLLIVWFLVRIIEKSSFAWKTVGLDWRRNSLLAILLGASLAILLLVAYIFTGYILGFNASPLSVFLKGVSLPILT
jgi:hypothetical protein